MSEQGYVDAHHHIWRQDDLPWLMGPMVPRIFGPSGSSGPRGSRDQSGPRRNTGPHGRSTTGNRTGGTTTRRKPARRSVHIRNALLAVFSLVLVAAGGALLAVRLLDRRDADATRRTATRTTTERLADIAATDERFLESLDRQWVPRLAVSLAAPADLPAETFTESGLLDEYDRLHGDFGAVLVSTSDHADELDADRYVVVAPAPYAQSAGALEWCRNHETVAARCVAYRITPEAEGAVVVARPDG